MQTYIFFLCLSVTLAEEAAVSIDQQTLLPEGCQMTREKVGTVDEVLTEVLLPSGGVAIIGSVRMADGKQGYSAGLLPEIY